MTRVNIKINPTTALTINAMLKVKSNYIDDTWGPWPVTYGSDHQSCPGNTKKGPVNEFVERFPK